MGMVNAVVPHAELEAVALEWGARSTRKSPTAQRMLKFAFNAVDDGLVGQQVFAGEATRLAYMTDEAVEGRDAFLEKRDPDWSPFPGTSDPRADRTRRRSTTCARAGTPWTTRARLALQPVMTPYCQFHGRRQACEEPCTSRLGDSGLQLGDRSAVQMDAHADRLVEPRDQLVDVRRLRDALLSLWFTHEREADTSFCTTAKFFVLTANETIRK
jgi:hypothetical protein